MNLQQLRCVLEIARVGSVTKAASNLGISQPTLSKQIKDLEAELGCKLFVRSSYSVRLTEEGMVLRRRAEDIVGMVDTAVEEIRSIGNKVSDFAAEMLEFSAGADGRCSLCDACTVVWLIDPEIIKKSLHVHVDVETKGEFTRGMTVCDWREYMDMDPKQDIAHEKVAEHPFAGMKEPNVEVAMEFDQPRFRKLLMDTLRMYG